VAGRHVRAAAHEAVRGIATAPSRQADLKLPATPERSASGRTLEPGNSARGGIGGGTSKVQRRATGGNVPALPGRHLARGYRPPM